jgi:hypothetical protein
VLDHRRAGGTPRQPDGKLLAEPEHGIVPAFADLDQGGGEIGMLFAKERLNETGVDRTSAAVPTTNYNHHYQPSR